MGRSILGVLAGLVVGIVLVALVETLGMRLIPPPPGMDPTDPASIAAAMRNMPIGSFLFVLAAWFLGTGVGVSTAMRFASSTTRGRSRPASSTSRCRAASDVASPRRVTSMTIG